MIEHQQNFQVNAKLSSPALRTSVRFTYCLRRLFFGEK